MTLYSWRGPPSLFKFCTPPPYCPRMINIINLYPRKIFLSQLWFCKLPELESHGNFRDYILVEGGPSLFKFAPPLPRYNSASKKILVMFQKHDDKPKILSNLRYQLLERKLVEKDNAFHKKKKLTPLRPNRSRSVYVSVRLEQSNGHHRFSRPTRPLLMQQLPIIRMGNPLD